MTRLRASSYLAIAYVVFRIAGLVLFAVYARPMSFAISDIISVVTIALLIAGAVTGLRNADSRFLLIAWSFVAGCWAPALFRRAEMPERFQHIADPHNAAMIRYGWEYDQRLTLYAATASVAIAVIGLLLSLWRPRAAA